MSGVSGKDQKRVQLENNVTANDNASNGIIQSQVVHDLSSRQTKACDRSRNTNAVTQSGKKVISPPATLFMWSKGQGRFMLLFSFWDQLVVPLLLQFPYIYEHFLAQYSSPNSLLRPYFRLLPERLNQKPLKHSGPLQSILHSLALQSLISQYTGFWACLTTRFILGSNQGLHS